MIPKTTKVKALANFASLGLSDEHRLYGALRKWIRYEKTLQGILHNGHASDLVYGNIPTRNDDMQCRFFITAHYGIYPLIIRYLANLFPEKKITCLVGKQKSIEALKRLVENNGLNVDFIEIGKSIIFLRRCIKSSQKGCVFLSLIDIPLGVTDKTDETIRFLCGDMKVKGGLVKLASKLNLTPRFIVSGYDHSRKVVPINSFSVSSVEDIFHLFEQNVRLRPYLWDKVTDLHEFYKSDIEPDIYIPFSLSGSYFALNVKSQKVIQTNQALYHKICCLRSGRLNSDDTQRCRTQIYEQTNIRIQQAI